MATKRDAFLPPIISGGYSGHVIPVNPTTREICGLPVVNDVKNLPPDIDVAMVILSSGREGIDFGRFQSGRRPIARRSRATSRTNEELYA
jgi:hypothetical protein